MCNHLIRHLFHYKKDHFGFCHKFWVKLMDLKQRDFVDLFYFSLNISKSHLFIRKIILRVTLQQTERHDAHFGHDHLPQRSYEGPF